MPRKPDGDVAMTSTERVHRFRERQRAANPVWTDRQKLTQAQAEIVELRRQLATHAKSELEIVALRQRIAVLEQAAKAKPAKAKIIPVGDEKDQRIAALEKTNSGLRKKMN